MPQTRNKGQAGMGSRGKNKPKNRQDKATRKRRTTVPLRGDKGEGGVSIAPPGTPRMNQKRNQSEWHKARRMRHKY